MKYLLFLLLALLSAVPGVRAQTATTGQAYRIYDVKAGRETSFGELVSRIPQKSILLFGEQHDDATGHQLEDSLLQQLYARFGKHLLLSMEMFERDVQPVLDEYLKDIISEKNFRSEARAWDNYADYRPLIERAKDHHIPVIAANAPARYVNLVARKGLTALYQLDRSARQWIGPLPVDTLSGRYAQKFLEAMGGHTMPGMHLYESQNLWDATMAYSIKKALQRHRRATVLQLNGRFHSDDHTGLAERLRRLRRPVLTISCFRAEDFDRPDWDAYKTLADFVILTRPAAP